MSGTQTVYSSNLRSRRVNSLNNNKNKVVSKKNQNALPQTCSANQSSVEMQNSSSISRIPAGNELREARLNRFQPTYDHDKEVFKAKEKAKEIKKINDKLKRYKGVGELGNKCKNEPLTDQEKKDNYWKSRDNYQNLHYVSSSQTFEERSRREIEETQLLSERLSLNSEANGSNEDGHRLGGNNRLNRARGEHPLLAKLSNTIQ